MLSVGDRSALIESLPVFNSGLPCASGPHYAPTPSRTSRDHGACRRVRRHSPHTPHFHSHRPPTKIQHRISSNSPIHTTLCDHFVSELHRPDALCVAPVCRRRYLRCNRRHDHSLSRRLSACPPVLASLDSWLLLFELD